MDRQELIKKYEDKLKDVQLKFGANFKTKVYEGLIKDLKQLDEPQKVTLPRYVADWIKYFKKTGDWDLFQAMDDLFGKERKVHEWLEAKHNQELFARAWLDGYTVEEEKRYRVKLKSNPEEVDYLVDTKRNGFRFYSNIYVQSREHTRKEIEAAGFGWVFACPGIEIEEVE